MELGSSGNSRSLGSTKQVPVSPSLKKAGQSTDLIKSKPLEHFHIEKSSQGEPMQIEKQTENSSHKKRKSASEHNYNHRAKLSKLSINTQGSPPLPSPAESVEEHSEPVAQTEDYPSGTLYFVNNEREKQQAIDYFRQKYPKGHVVYISSLEDIDRAGLIKLVFVEDNKIITKKGRAYLDEPIAVITDFRKFISAESSSLNEFTQPEAKLNGLRCSNQLQRIAFISEKMLIDKMLDPSVFRRLEHMKRLPVPSSEGPCLIDNEILEQRSTDRLPDEPVLTIDFVTSNDWFRLLFGGIGLNERGGIEFQPGCLDNLKDCHQLILKNAPWENPRFVQKLATVFREGRYEANDEEITLPKNLTFTKEQVTKDQLSEKLKERCADQNQFSQEAPIVFINQNSLSALQNNHCIENSKVVSKNLVHSLVSNTSQLVITGKLTHHQWLWLLDQLKKLPDNRPPLFRELEASVYQQIIKPVANGTPSSVPYNYWPNDTDSVASMLQTIEMTSQNQMTFKCHDTEVMEHLRKGNPVVFHGVENYPKMNGLETLLARPVPYVFIQGQKITLPNAQVSFVRTGETTRKALDLSPVIKAVIKPCPKPPCTTEFYPKAHKIYDILMSLSPSPTNSYPPSPPWPREEFISLFLKQIEIEKKFEKLYTEPTYNYRALKVLVGKMYRRDPEVYGFLKYTLANTFKPYPEKSTCINDPLIRWLRKHQELTTDKIRNSFWHLRSCFTMELKLEKYFPTEFSCSPTDKAIYALLLYIREVVQEEASISTIEKLIKKLSGGISDFPRIEKLTVYHYNSDVFSSIGYALFMTNGLLINNLAIPYSTFSIIRDLKHKLRWTLDKGIDKKITLVRNQLATLYTNDNLPDKLQDLPQAIVNGQKHKYISQQRRLFKLSNRINHTPVVFLQGEAGVGKTFMAGEVAKLRGQPLKTIQFGRHTTMEALMGQQELEPVKTITAPDEEQGIDHRTCLKKGALFEWLENQEPPLLLIDEANLASEEVLKALLGTLKNEPPIICYQGKVYKLTDKHRIILTGNPDCYPGRHSWIIAKQNVPIFYYHPMDSQTIKEDIIKQDLPERWPDDLKNHACEAVFTLYKNYQEHFPGEPLTPRDLKDLLAILKQIIRYQPDSENVTEAMVNALVWRAFSDCLADALDAGNQSHLDEIRLNYNQQFSSMDDSVLKGVNEAAGQFTDKLQKKYPDADFTTKKTRELSDHYWQFLDKGNLGRKALLVEGPAGWGKDFILDKVLQQWHEDKGTAFEHINANPNQWDLLVEKVHKAMKSGTVIAISELNLIPSHYLESLLNTILTEPATEGFKIIATINPVSFGGRSPLSDALKNRFSRYTVLPFSRAEMVEMLARVPRINPDLPGWLAEQIDQLSMQLERCKSPVRLSRSIALRLVEKLNKQPKAGWISVFNESCYLAKRSLELLQGADKQLKKSGPNQKNKLCRVGSGAQAKLDGVLPITIDGNTTKSVDYKLDQLFSSLRLHPRDYRLQLYKLQFSKDSVAALLLNSNGQVQTPVPQLRPWPKNHHSVALEMDEVLGRYSVKADGNWHALPGVTPQDQLTMLRPENAFNISYSPETNQWLVQSKAPQEQAPKHDHWITTDFVIKPQYYLLEDLRSPECLSTQPDNDHLLDASIRQKLKEALFDNRKNNRNFNELKKIDSLANAKKKILALKKLFKYFQSDEDVKGEDLELLINIIREEQGVCRHRSWCFQLLCEYWDIPCRIVDNQCHNYPEVSFDGGNIWYRIELGGGSNKNGSIEILSADFPNHIGGGESESAKKWWHSLSSNASGNYDNSKRVQMLKAIICLKNNQQISSEYLNEFKKTRSYWFSCEKANPGKYQWEMWGSLLQIFIHSGFFQHYCDNDFTNLLNETIDLIDPSVWPENIFIDETLCSFSRLSEKNDEDKKYLNWLFKLCEEHEHIQPVIFSLMAKYLRKHGEVDYGDLIREKLYRRELPKIEFKRFDQSKQISRQPNQALKKIVTNMPINKKLQNLLVDISIDRSFSSTPKENTEIDIGRLTSKLPAFVEKKVIHKSKRIILDLCADTNYKIMRNIIESVMSNLLNFEVIVKKNKGYYQIYQIFIAWLLRYGEQENIHYLYSDYRKGLFLDTADTALTDGFLQCISAMRIDRTDNPEGLSASAEIIRKHFQAPESVVLQGDTLLTLCDEFLEQLLDVLQGLPMS